MLATPARAAEVTVFAAASLKTALDEIAAEWQADTGHSVVMSYGGSSALAKQIIEAAPADIFHLGVDRVDGRGGRRRG